MILQDFFFHFVQYPFKVKLYFSSIFSYFSEESTQEMLDEWRPLMCPYDVTFGKAMFYFSLFLPTTLHPEKHDQGYKYGFNDLMINKRI